MFVFCSPLRYDRQVGFVMSAALPLALPKTASFATKPVLPPALTGVQGLDQEGGIPRAALTEFWGRTSSGRTSLLLSALRKNTDRGEFCALIDGQDAFDPQTAEMELSRLLWVRCASNPGHALKAADLLVHAGGFCLVILDLTGFPARTTNRIPIASWFRLRHGAEQSGTALVVTGEQPLTGSCAHWQLGVRSERVLWSDKLLRGTSVHTEYSKRRNDRATFCTTR